jgi:hypothetical protein
MKFRARIFSYKKMQFWTLFAGSAELMLQPKTEDLDAQYTVSFWCRIGWRYYCLTIGWWK